MIRTIITSTGLLQLLWGVRSGQEQVIKQLYDEILASQPLQNPAGELRRLRLEREHIQRRVGCTFSTISRFLERFLAEHIEVKNS